MLISCDVSLEQSGTWANFYQICQMWRHHFAISWSKMHRGHGWRYRKQLSKSSKRWSFHHQSSLSMIHQKNWYFKTTHVNTIRFSAKPGRPSDRVRESLFVGRRNQICEHWTWDVCRCVWPGEIPSLLLWPASKGCHRSQTACSDRTEVTFFSTQTTASHDLAYAEIQLYAGVYTWIHYSDSRYTVTFTMNETSAYELFHVDMTT